MRRRAVFLDRDGVINENRPDYVKSWDEYVFLPGALEALRQLATSDFAILVISNQSAVGRGLISPQQLEDIHRRMVQEIERSGGRIDAIECCPHRPADGCGCRKPRPGLLQRAAARFDLDLTASYLVGDAQTDVEAALNAGCQPILVRTGRGQDQLRRVPPGLAARCRVVDDLSAAVATILEGG